MRYLIINVNLNATLAWRFTQFLEARSCTVGVSHLVCFFQSTVVGIVAASAVVNRGGMVDPVEEYAVTWG